MATEDIHTPVLLLSAGLGKRLRPLTDNLPKPLVKINGKTLIERNLEMIARSGFRRVYINLFYLGEQIEKFVGDGSRWGLSVAYVVEKELLDTGGAIRNIFPMSGARTLLTVNCDIVIGQDFELGSVLKAHSDNKNQPLATLVLRDDPGALAYGAVCLDGSGRVNQILDAKLTSSPMPPVRTLMFLGVQALDVRLIDLMPEIGVPFSITRDTYRGIIKNDGYLGGLVYNGYWSDVGTPERLEQASNDLKRIIGSEKPLRDI